MRKVLAAILACCIGIGVSDAAVRDSTTVARATTTRDARPRSTNTANIISRTTATTTSQTRSTVTGTNSRTKSNSRNNTTGSARATVGRSATNRTNNNTVGQSRSAISQGTSSRATTTIDAPQSKTFGTGYNTCRDAYFTCMDQFCASANDTYRRCVCSSRLYEIQSKQRALNQSADQLQDFKDLNIAVIPKTAAEVQAMQHASQGEIIASIVKDKSSSMAQLAGISSVLSKTKSKSLSTAGQLDIAGDINAIWATTDLTSGLNISNLSGEALYSAVHAQCADIVSDYCSSKSLLNMVVSAYSMYIENDCSLLANALDKKKVSANAAIRETEREMNTARQENYDAHNYSSINECISMVRQDITADAACGRDFVHCLDTTGLYLNAATGEPIYTSAFYQLGSLLSLSGDILNNKENRSLVLELNRKRIFAENSLDTCRDLSSSVWDEFLRQAIAEIYQVQQTKIREVKSECLDVINQCYDAQNKSLRDFSNVKEQLLLGSRLELSEKLCEEKLNACSNLYGGGQDGLAALNTAMQDIVTQQIAQNCFQTLQEYVQEMCAVSATDTLHSYPYACRAYAPGEQQYATIWSCNTQQKQTYNNNDDSYSTITRPSQAGMCANKKRYTSCNAGYYMMDMDGNIIYRDDYATNTRSNVCVKCPAKGCPTRNENNDVVYESICGDDYIGSLYQKLVRYAINACMRPSEIENLNNNETTGGIPGTLLQDVNATMDILRVSMASSLKSECERLGGYWMSSQWDKSVEETTGITVLQQFYNETGANKKWGYCADPDTVAEFYTGKSQEDDTDSENPEDPQSDLNP